MNHESYGRLNVPSVKRFNADSYPVLKTDILK